METWVNKYSPDSLENIILNDSTRKLFSDYIKKNNLPCITLAGRPGIGKTTCANILVNSLKGCNHIYINASSENGIDTVRNKISDFVDCQSIGGGLKVVILDEADGLTRDGQKCLRSIMEKDLDDTRFILTCNTIDDIIPPIRSRGPVINIRYKFTDVVKHIFSILIREKVKFEDKDKIIIINKIKKYYPDIRQIINVMEQCCISGAYTDAKVDTNDDADNIIDYILENLKYPSKCREHWIKNEAVFNSDYLRLAAKLMNKFDDAETLLVLGEKYYQLNIVLDKEIGFYMMVLQLSKL
jgi:replication factor C small subunit